nr:MAG TPA: hypothetical protein [Caudoviricetes sp.]
MDFNQTITTIQLTERAISKGMALLYAYNMAIPGNTISQAVTNFWQRW